MVYGKNGATCWLAGAVRTLQKWLEANDSSKNVAAAASYFTLVPVVESIAPATSYVTPAPVVDNIVPTPAVDDGRAPVGEYISPAPGGIRNTSTSA